MRADRDWIGGVGVHLPVGVDSHRDRRGLGQDALDLVEGYIDPAHPHPAPLASDDLDVVAPAAGAITGGHQTVLAGQVKLADHARRQRALRFVQHQPPGALGRELPGCQDIQVAKAAIRVGGGAAQQPEQAFAEGVDRAAVEQVGRILDLADDSGMRAVCGVTLLQPDVHRELRHPGDDVVEFHLQPGQLDLDLVEVLEGQHHLEQRMV